MFWIAPYTLYLAPPWIWVPLGASLGLLRHAKIFCRTRYCEGFETLRQNNVARSRASPARGRLD